MCAPTNIGNFDRCCLFLQDIDADRVGTNNRPTVRTILPLVISTNDMLSVIIDNYVYFNLLFVQQRL